MTALNQLATHLRLNAASMEHGDAEADIRAAEDRNNRTCLHS